MRQRERSLYQTDFRFEVVVFEGIGLFAKKIGPAGVPPSHY